MRKLMVLAAAVAVVGGLLALNGGALAGGKPGSFNSQGAIDEWLFDPGFDEWGYNYRAHLFSGIADGFDREWGGAGAYDNDLLVMKWSDEWLTYTDSDGDGKLDRCQGTPQEGTSACPGAWLTNEWNGMGPDGSREVWHYKITYSEGCESSGTPSPGAYCVWGAYEVIMDQGVDPTHTHFWYALTQPNGFGP